MGQVETGSEETLNELLVSQDNSRTASATQLAAQRSSGALCTDKLLQVSQDLWGTYRACVGMSPRWVLVKEESSQLMMGSLSPEGL